MLSFILRLSASSTSIPKWKHLMGTSLQEKIASLPPERQAQIKAETAHLQATYMTLKDLRRAHDMTQAHLAKQPGKR